MPNPYVWFIFLRQEGEYCKKRKLIGPFLIGSKRWPDMTNLLDLLVHWLILCHHVKTSTYALKDKQLSETKMFMVHCKITAWWQNIVLTESKGPLDESAVFLASRQKQLMTEWGTLRCMQAFSNYHALVMTTFSGLSWNDSFKPWVHCSFLFLKHFKRLIN